MEGGGDQNEDGAYPLLSKHKKILDGIVLIGNHLGANQFTEKVEGRQF
jgi:hypothetical protein